jgi:hypothetical protein
MRENVLLRTANSSLATKVKVPGCGGTASQLPSLACTSRPSTSCCTIVVITLASRCASMDTLVSVSGGTP